MDTAADFARADTEHLDVLIVGAGLSGIGAAWHLQDKCPGRTYAIVEARETSGGTWDLFRYPGIRSDSDMYTLGYSFRPWKDAKAIADGPAILSYIRDVASDHGIDGRIRYGHRVVAARWSTPEARWTVEIEQGPDKRRTTITCGFLLMCSGYYDYAAGYLPQFPGVERFAGRIVHPQKWTDDIDYKGKRVVVVGSGATAVTLVPEMAKDAAHVTMLQRSPTYVVARPAEDAIANWLRRYLPIGLAYGMTRWKNVLLGMWFYQLCKRKPERAKALILKGVRYCLGPDYDIDRHFTPRYNPWDQRLCLVPDADLFRAIRRKQVSVVTDEIVTFTETGIRLRSGKELEADLIVTATGLALQLMGGMTVMVNGKTVEPADTVSYKGMMYSDVPNLAAVSGYTNASWTLKADLVCEYVCRLLNHMHKAGLRQCTPRLDDPAMERLPWVDFSSGYIKRAIDKFPKQGARKPWRLNQNYALDLMSLRYGSVEDRAMVFSK
ncbi:flavin-containing monooxygenase [Reyranella soli]|uniref:Cyclohexanone monooxygenase n=1 Tax=Reyranella soli TaxID=1230389 RepID=A0A512NBL7_9HYPH|nr:NAD(P)/FAD-dependent oxidoreductase [Reyranella soli]GEP56332.1 cyclohexanone monooxygenase [Reyranella soli]